MSMRKKNLAGEIVIDDKEATYDEAAGKKRESSTGKCDVHDYFCTLTKNCNIWVMLLASWPCILNIILLSFLFSYFSTLPLFHYLAILFLGLLLLCAYLLCSLMSSRTFSNQGLYPLVCPQVLAWFSFDVFKVSPLTPLEWLALKRVEGVPFVTRRLKLFVMIYAKLKVPKYFSNRIIFIIKMSNIGKKFHFSLWNKHMLLNCNTSWASWQCEAIYHYFVLDLIISGQKIQTIEILRYLIHIFFLSRMGLSPLHWLLNDPSMNIVQECTRLSSACVISVKKSSNY